MNTVGTPHRVRDGLPPLAEEAERVHGIERRGLAPPELLGGQGREEVVRGVVGSVLPRDAGPVEGRLDRVYGEDRRSEPPTLPGASGARRNPGRQGGGRSPGFVDLLNSVVGASRLLREDGVAMANRPLLLVDIDGVLNPWQADPCPEGFEEHVVWPEDDVPLWLSSVHGVWLRELAEIFDLVWASAWGRDAKRVYPLLDIPELPHVSFPPIPFEPAEKVPAIRHYVADRPAAWVDDSITAEAWTWAAERRARTLLMWVPPWTGLQRPHVDYLLTWAGSVE